MAFFHIRAYTHLKNVSIRVRKPLFFPLRAPLKGRRGCFPMGSVREAGQGLFCAKINTFQNQRKEAPDTKRMVAELIDHIEVYHAEKQDGITNQRVVIHYNCIGAFDVPDRRKIPEADIIMETRKGVALSYAPEQVAV